MYGPDGFKNPYYDTPDEIAKHSIYEAGADAMHKADVEWINKYDIRSHIVTTAGTKIIEIFDKDWEKFTRGVPTDIKCHWHLEEK